MKYYVGIDGGGTKTHVLVFDEKFNVVFDKIYSSCHFISIGRQGFENLITEIKEDLQTVQVFDNIIHAFFALAGYGEIAGDNLVMDEIIKMIFTKPHTVKNDSIAGWAGSLLCEDGINVISGTGSIAVGVKNQDFVRVGGWGYIVGDEGSAFWIGIKTINAYSKMYDGRLEKTVLFDLINKAYALDENQDFMYLVYTKMAANRTNIATFAKVCAEAASNNCPISDTILRDAASEIVSHLDVISYKLDFPKDVKVSYSGGTFNSQIFLEYFKNCLSKQNFRYHLVEQNIKPAHGSALYAYVLAGNEVTDDLRKNILQKYG